MREARLERQHAERLLTRKSAGAPGGSVGQALLTLAHVLISPFTAVRPASGSALTTPSQPEIPALSLFLLRVHACSLKMNIKKLFSQSLEKAKLLGQKANQWLPGAGEASWGDRSILDLEGVMRTRLYTAVELQKGRNLQCVNYILTTPDFYSVTGPWNSWQPGRWAWNQILKFHTILASNGLSFRTGALAAQRRGEAPCCPLQSLRRPPFLPSGPRCCDILCGV